MQHRAVRNTGSGRRLLRHFVSGFSSSLEVGAKLALIEASSHDDELLVLPSQTLANHLIKQGSGDEMPC